MSFRQRLQSLFGTKLPARSTREIAEFFNRASHDEEHFPSKIDPRIYHVKLVLDHLAGSRTVADVGCGKGRFARLVKDADPSRKVVCLDLSETMLRHAGAGLERVTSSMTAIPLADGCCDAGRNIGTARAGGGFGIAGIEYVECTIRCIIGTGNGGD